MKDHNCQARGSVLDLYSGVTEGPSFSKPGIDEISCDHAKRGEGALPAPRAPGAPGQQHLAPELCPQAHQLLLMPTVQVPAARQCSCTVHPHGPLTVLSGMIERLE